MARYNKAWGALIGALLALLGAYGINLAAEHVAVIQAAEPVLVLLVSVLFPAAGAYQAPANRP
jgi:hypothetical protein